MKMKKIYKLLAACLLTSCSYLDVVPPEQPDLDDMLRDEASTVRMLYSCYSYAQAPQLMQMAYCMEMGGDDAIVAPQEWENGGSKVQWNAVTPSSINSNTTYIWEICYNGIGYCNLFLKLIDEHKPDINPNSREQYICEAKFLKAYYHYRLLALFGPIPIVDGFIEADTDKTDFPGRSHFDYCVEYICNLLDEAETSLPPVYSSTQHYGRATSVACKAIKARTRILAASPLWNGSFPDRTWRNKSFETPGYGKELVSLEYDENKWEVAKLACEEAIQAAEAAGAELFDLEASEVLRQNQNIGLPVIPGMNDSAEWDDFRKRVIMLRYLVTTSKNDGNNETVWGFVLKGTALKDNNTVMASHPHWVLKDVSGQNIGGYGGLSPTLYTVEHFFTDKGLLPEDDPAFVSEADYHKSAGLSNPDITNINVGREPRYYASISFDGDEYSTRMAIGKPIYCEMRNPAKTGYDKDLWGTRNYVVTGFLNKKWIHPNFQYTGTGWNCNYASLRAPLPRIRLGEMYLSMAECLAQCGEDEEALKWLNRIRVRAGVPAWTLSALSAKNKTVLDAVLDERFVECFMEGYRYYDIRRYLQGSERMSKDCYKGLNAIQTGPTFEQFNQVVQINQPFEWNDRMYLLPVSNDEVYSNPNMVQAPGY